MGQSLGKVIPPNGWQIIRPVYDARARTWHCSPVRLKRSGKVADHDVVAAAGPSEPAVIVELVRCLSEAQEGRVPR